MSTVTDAPPVPYPKALERHPTLRQSLLAQFDRCGLTTKFSIEHERAWSSHDQARGQLFHRVAAKCLETMAEHEENTIPPGEALAILDEVLRQDDVDRWCPKCGGTLEPGGKRHMRCVACGEERWSELVAVPQEQIQDLRMSVKKWAHDNEFNIANLASIEERLEKPIAYPSDFGPVERILTGQLDALFYEGRERGVVLDWKDTWALPPQTEVSFTGYFQQRFYGLLVFHSYPKLREVTLREFYVRYSEAREATLHRDQVPDVETELAALAERFDRAVETGIFTPSPGKHCTWCIKPHECPIIPAGRVEGAINSPEEARRVAGEITVAKAVIEKRTKALKSWANRHGDTPVSDAKGNAVYGYEERETTSRPTKEELETALRAAGADRAVDVDRLYRRKKGTKFSLHQKSLSPAPDPEDQALAEKLRQSVERAQRANDERG